MATSSSSRTERGRARRLAFLLTAALLSAPLAAAFAQTELPTPSRERPPTSTPPASAPKSQPERVPSLPSSSGGNQPSNRGPRTTPSDVLHDTERRGAPPVGGGGTLSAPDSSGGGDVSGQIRDLGKSAQAQSDKKASQKKAASEKKTDAKKRPASRPVPAGTVESVPVDRNFRTLILPDEAPGLKPPTPPQPAPPPDTGGGTPPAAPGGGTAATPGGGTPPAAPGGGTPPAPGGGTTAGGGTPSDPLAYVNDCRDKSVPIPPPWGDPGWKKVKTLKPEELWVLGENGQTAEVWTFETKDGLCVALPRYRGTTLIAMGIICQSRTGYACFWDLGAVTTDGKSNPGQKANPKGVKVEDMPNGANLKEVCTDCHRGSNVFIGHAGIPTIGGQEDDPYKPLSGGRKEFVNPKAPDDFAPNCQSCHILPELTKAYCQKVLKPALSQPSEGGKAAMPPPGEKASDYKDDIEQLRKKCKDLGVTL